MIFLIKNSVAKVTLRETEEKKSLLIEGLLQVRPAGTHFNWPTSFSVKKKLHFHLYPADDKTDPGRPRPVAEDTLGVAKLPKSTIFSLATP